MMHSDAPFFWPKVSGCINLKRVSSPPCAEKWRLSESYGLEAKQAWVGALLYTLRALRHNRQQATAEDDRGTEVQQQQAAGKRGGKAQCHVSCQREGTGRLQCVEC